MSLKDKGSIMFWLRHEQANWTTNRDGYDFGMRNEQGICVTAVKHPDTTIELKLMRPFYEVVTFRQLIPECDERGLMVTFTWEGHEVKLYLNAKLMDTKSTDPQPN